MDRLIPNMADIDYQFAAKFMTFFLKYRKYYFYNEVCTDFSLLSSNPLITMAYVKRHPEHPWCWQGLTSNPSITLEYMDQHPELPWNKDEYHFRKFGGEATPIEPTSLISLAELEQQICLNEPAQAAQAPAAGAGAEAQAPTNNIITVYDEAELDTWTKLSDNPNLTFDFISKYHKKPWNYYVLASNPFPAAKKQFKKEYLAALKIQEAFARAKYIPLYAYCRKLHSQFYDDMVAGLI